MSNSSRTVYLSGRVYWAKIFGDPPMNYARDGREWTLEFEPEDMSAVDAAGLSEKVRDRSNYVNQKGEKPYEGRAPFMTLKQKELDRDGNVRDPIRVVDAANQPWDDKKKLGNGTKVDVKLGVVDYGPGKKDGVYPNAIRVLELVPYQSSDFEPLPADSPYYKEPVKDTFKEDFGIAEPAVAVEEKPKRAKKAVPEEELNDELPV